MADLWTEDPRAVETYDIENAGRWDHDFYLAIADEIGARSLVDIGCGTGVFCIDVARRGMEVIGVDPAEPMLAAARARPDGGTVTWLHGDASAVPTGIADLVVMMGHVAQYFVADQDWGQVLTECHRILRDGGRLAFETRNPDRGWAHRWTRALSEGTLAHPDGGEFTTWVEVVDTSGPATSFTQTHVGHTTLPDGTAFEHAETLRFRSEHEIRDSLRAAGFEVAQMWGDWDRSPVRTDSDELIVLAAAAV